MRTDERDPKFHFLRDIENHLRSESLPEARESLGDWTLRSKKNAKLTQAAEEDSRRIDDLLHDKSLQRREERVASSPQEWLLIQAVRQDKTLVRRPEEEQQKLDETLSHAAALRKECDRQLAELSRREQMLEGKKQAILRRITMKFYDYSSTRLLKLLRLSAKAFASEEVRRQFAQQIGDRLCPEASLESRAATRAAKIIKLGNRHGIDDERVADWIRGGISLVAIRAAILDEFASQSAQPATAAEPETPAPRTDGNNSGLYDRELAEVFRLGIRGRVDRDQIAESIEKYWRPELTAAEFIAGVSGLRRLKVRTDKRSIVGEIFELFGEPDRAWEWKDEYVNFLLSKLVTDDKTVATTQELEPAADPPAAKSEPRIPAEEIGEQGVAQEQQSAANAAAEQLSERLERGKLCEEMAGEIKTIRGEARANGKAMFEIREAYPKFLVWNAEKSLLPEDRAVFEMPTRWGAANGYANLFLSKLFPPRSPSTVNDWRKEFRAHKRRNP